MVSLSYWYKIYGEEVSQIKGTKDTKRLNQDVCLIIFQLRHKTLINITESNVIVGVIESATDVC